MKEGKLSVSAQSEYLRAMQKRYHEADRSAKSHLLDELADSVADCVDEFVEKMRHYLSLC